MSGKRMVLGWELGTALGHLSEMLPLIRTFAGHEIDVALMLRELQNVAQFNLPDVPVMQSPVWMVGVKGLPEPPLSFAEILLRYGYHDPVCLHGLVMGWCSALKALNAGAVVASYAPTALLAARILKIPAVTLGSGFNLPPKVNPLPNMRPWLSVSTERLIEADKWATRSINGVLEQYGCSTLTSVSELFDVEANLLCTFPELDHYALRIAEMQRAHYVGALVGAKGEVVEWPASEGPRVLVYLRPEVKGLDALMQALKTLGCNVVAFIPGLSATDQAKFQSPTCLVMDRMVRLDKLLPTCHLAVNYGGHGFVSTALLAGVPLLLLPLHLEQFLIGQRVLSLGAGIVLDREESTDYTDSVRKMLTDTSFKQAAHGFAAKYATFDPIAQRNMIVNTIQSLIE